MYYTHKHFYVSQDPVGHWIVYSSPAFCLACFSSRSSAYRVRNHLQGLLELLDFVDLSSCVDFLIASHKRDFIMPAESIKSFLLIGSLCKHKVPKV